MAGYLEGYGAGVDRRIRLFKWAAAGLVIAIIVGVALYFLLRDHSEKQRLEAFFQDLRQRDYKNAYSLWGCTDTTPCRDYAYSKFLEDWGPSSQHANIAAAKIEKTKSCSTGIIQIVQFPSDEVQLWVDRRTKTIGFAPWPVCNPRMQVQ